MYAYWCYYRVSVVSLCLCSSVICIFFFNDTATTEIYTYLTHSFPTRRSSDLRRARRRRREDAHHLGPDAQDAARRTGKRTAPGQTRRVFAVSRWPAGGADQVDR